MVTVSSDGKFVRKGKKDLTQSTAGTEKGENADRRKKEDLTQRTQRKESTPTQSG
jgi:hypothetical protein